MMVISKIFRSIALLLILAVFSMSFPAPVKAASLSVNPPSGIVGSIISITGEGFSGQFANIYWDDLIVDRDIRISDDGSFKYDLTIPHAGRGEHVIFIDDDSNWSPSSALFGFTVLPCITVFPDTGDEFNQVTITGRGFGSDETDIGIVWDGDAQPGISVTADSFGTWYYEFTIPFSTKGEHYISAEGSVTGQTEIGEKPFMVTPWAVVEPVSGPVGTQLIVKGWGFRTMEDGITITWDNNIIYTNIQAEVDGTLVLDGTKRQNSIGHDSEYREAIYVPESSRGKHIVGIYGSSFTPKGELPDTEFTVTPQIKIEPTSGKKGTEVTLSGTGFASNEPVKISFHKTVLDTNIFTDDAGSFSTVFNVPQNAAKENKIIVVDNSGNSSEIDFTSEETMYLQAPKLISPANGTNITIFESVLDLFIGTGKYIIGIFDYWKGTRTEAYQLDAFTFSWTDMNPNVGAKYVLQVASDNTFSSYILNKEIQKSSEYTLANTDTITKGNYYWRVKAEYAAGEESPWSEVSEFSVNSMPVTVIILSIVIAILCLAAIVFGVLIGWANLSK